MAKTDLPEVQKLMKDSWELFKLSWKKLLLFNLAMLGIVVVAVIIGLLLFGLTVGGGVYALGNGSFDLAKLSAVGGIIFVWVVILIAFALVLGAVNQAGSILAITNREKGISDLLKKGLHYAPLLVGASLLTMLLAIPAFFLFIIPGILVIFFLYFAPYSIVLGDRGTLDSLRRSIYLVKSNFWGLLLRAFVIAGLFILVGFAFSIVSVATVKIPGLLVLVSLLRTLVNIALGWYVITYSITLYRQLESASGKEGRGKLFPFVILSIASLVFAALIAGSIIKAVSSSPEIKNAILNSANSSSLGSGDSLKETYKSAFLNACGNGGSAEDKRVCKCIADKIVNKYSTKELQDIIKIAAQTKETPKEFTDAAKACISTNSQ